MADYLEQSLAKLEEFEGAISWMYRDTVGRVTVGVGLMLSDVSRAQALPFQSAGRPLPPEAIAAEFTRVNALPMGRPAPFYRREGGAELTPESIADLLREVVEGLDGQLRTHVTGYDALPDTARLALLDMGYNLGLHGLLDGFPRLIRAVENRQWSQAAANCFRHGPGAARNEWTRQMLASCVLSTVEGVAEAAESSLVRLGYGLLGALASAWEALRRPKVS